MLDCRLRQIALVSKDSQSERSWAVSVLSQYRVLEFVADNVGETKLLRKPLKDINVGTYDNLHVAFMDTLAVDVIHMMFDCGISSVPILGDEGGSTTGSMMAIIS